MYKVFINDKVIFFTNNNDIILQAKNGFFIHFYENNFVKNIYELLIDDAKCERVVVKTHDVDAAFNSFRSNFKFIRAAGGKVKNTEGKILFIFRLGKWDLPKGKIEEGESIEQAAVREVEEECGIANIKIIKPLKDTFHIYELNGELILKQSYWFEMETNDTSKLVPQIEENITDAQWMTQEEMENTVLKNTYPSIKEVLEKT